MRDLSRKEIDELLESCYWGTLMLVDGDKPYGIELSHLIQDDMLYIFFNPNGKAGTCIAQNSNVAYKVCKAEDQNRTWSAATVFSSIEKVTDHQMIYNICILIGKRLGKDMDDFKKRAEHFAALPAEKSPLYCLSLQDVSGKHS